MPRQILFRNFATFVADYGPYLKLWSRQMMFSTKIVKPQNWMMTNNYQLQVTMSGQVIKSNETSISGAVLKTVQYRARSQAARLTSDWVILQQRCRQFLFFVVFVIVVAVFVFLFVLLLSLFCSYWGVPNPTWGRGDPAGQVGQVLNFFRNSEMSGNIYVYSFFSGQQ